MAKTKRARFIELDVIKYKFKPNHPEIDSFLDTHFNEETGYTEVLYPGSDRYLLSVDKIEGVFIDDPNTYDTVIETWDGYFHVNDSYDTIKEQLV